MGLTIAEGNLFVATFEGKFTSVEFAILWECLAGGVGVGLIDFSAVTEFLDAREIQFALMRAKPIPPSRLAFVCRDDLAFGTVRQLVSVSNLNADYNVFRHRKSAIAWLDLTDCPLAA